MKTFVVGDLHGRRAQLRQLIELIPRDPAVDRLVLLGDLLDRGADIPGLVADVIALRDGNPARHLPARQPRTNAARLRG